jgi:hypothetical protein
MIYTFKQYPKLSSQQYQILHWLYPTRCFSHNDLYLENQPHQLQATTFIGEGDRCFCLEGERLVARNVLNTTPPIMNERTWRNLSSKKWCFHSSHRLMIGETQMVISFVKNLSSIHPSIHVDHQFTPLSGLLHWFHYIYN